MIEINPFETTMILIHVQPNSGLHSMYSMTALFHSRSQLKMEIIKKKKKEKHVISVGDDNLAFSFL